MSLQETIRRRQDALVKAWTRNSLIMVQVESPHALPGLVFLDTRGEGAAVGASGRRSEGNAVMVRGPGDADAATSVWVRANYQGYRGAYLAFIRQVYQVPADTRHLAGYDVDHLLNRARSPGGMGYIRIEAVPREVNQAWGRLFEKNASNPQFYANRARLRRTMSWTICAKLAGIAPPVGPGDARGIERLVQFFRSIGLDESEARAGIGSMLNFAYRFA